MLIHVRAFVVGHWLVVTSTQISRRSQEVPESLNHVALSCVNHLRLELLLGSWSWPDLSSILKGLSGVKGRGEGSGWTVGGASIYAHKKVH